jgi:diadenosine tetraphosphate (Ap4A) HIT family hydrolase
VTLERLWAGWRAAYIGGGGAEVPEGDCLFCGLAAVEGDEAQVIARGERTFAVLNAYPYTSGHLMVVPLVHGANLETLPPDDAQALMAMIQDGVTALKSAYKPDGVNVGMNLGRAAGAGMPLHLHVHVVPRWVGDTNFMTSVAETRILPESLSTSLERLRAAWPA